MTLSFNKQNEKKNKDYLEKKAKFVENLAIHNDIVAEKIVLSNLCQATTDIKLMGLIEQVKLDHFVTPLYHNVFKTVKALYERGMVVEKTSIVSILHKNKVELKENDIDTIGCLFTADLSTENFEYYVNKLEKEFLTRLYKLNNFENEHKVALAESKEEVEKILNESAADNEILKIGNSNRQERTSIDMINNMNRMLDNAQSDPMANVGILTGFNEFDIDNGGFKKGDFIIWGGATGGGKSISMSNIAYNISTQYNFKEDRYFRVLYIDLELGADKYDRRFDSIISGVNANLLMRGILTPEQKKLRTFEQGKFAKRFSFFNEQITVVNPKEIASILKIYKAKYNIDIAVVDYIGRVEDDSDAKVTKQKYEALSDIGKRLKCSATDLGICVVACAQLNKQAETAKLITKEHVAESYNLLAHADGFYAVRKKTDQEMGNEENDTAEDRIANEKWLRAKRENGNRLLFVCKSRDADTENYVYELYMNGALQMYEIGRNTKLKEWEKETRTILYNAYGDMYNKQGLKERELVNSL